MVWYWLTSIFVYERTGSCTFEKEHWQQKSVNIVLQWIWKHLETGLRMLQTLSDFLPQNCIHLASNCKLYSSYSSWHSGIHETAMPLAENEPCSVVALELPPLCTFYIVWPFHEHSAKTCKTHLGPRLPVIHIHGVWNRGSGVFPDLQQIHESSLQLPSLHGGCCSRSSPSQS